VTAAPRRANSRGFLREGVVAGILGATMMAVWFLLVDGAEGVPLRTPSILGSLVMTGDAAIPGGHPDMTAVVVYTLVHYGVFAATGVGAAAVARRSSRRPWLLLGLGLFLVPHAAFLLGATTIFAETLSGSLRWWTTLLGVFWAGAVMLAWLWSRYPGIERAMTDTELFEPR
jgi:hypothetical protein